MNEVLEEERMKWAVHGSYSGMHIYTNPEGADIVPSQFDAVAFIPKMLNKPRGEGVAGQLRMGHAGERGRYEFRPVGVDLGDAWGGGDGDHGRCFPSNDSGVEAGGDGLARATAATASSDAGGLMLMPMGPARLRHVGDAG